MAEEQLLRTNNPSIPTLINVVYIPTLWRPSGPTWSIFPISDKRTQSISCENGGTSSISSQDCYGGVPTTVDLCGKLELLCYAAITLGGLYHSHLCWSYDSVVERVTLLEHCPDRVARLGRVGHLKERGVHIRVERLVE